MSHPLILIETSSGDMLVALFPDAAPKTVANFLRYVDEGLYAYTIFHRVIEGFMVQGGGLTIKLEEKVQHPAIENEAGNGLKNVRGALAMARTHDPHSATCQFFINTVDNPELDYSDATAEGFGYCVFGELVEGFDVLERLEKVAIKVMGVHENLPADSIVITAVSRFEL